jgi:BirA family biotin operon repressor/biotin-[acetyl-CoA-carboxylase] ligase
VLGPVEIVDSIGSTNHEVARRARAGAAAGLVLVAEHQTAGRGRLDRTWEAAPGSSLLVSVLLRPRLRPEQAHLVSVAAGVAAAVACADVGARVGLKWPNDVVEVWEHQQGDALGTSPRKVAGILCELLLEGGAVAGVVVGMGLNLLEGPHIPSTGTSLEALTGAPIDRSTVLERWLAALEAATGDLDPASLVADYRRRCTTLGQLVRVDARAGVLEGRAVDVTADGHLVVLSGGGRTTVSEGDVTHVRTFAEPVVGTSSFDA